MPVRVIERPDNCVSIGRNGDILAWQLPASCGWEIAEFLALGQWIWNNCQQCTFLCYHNSPQYLKLSLFQHPKLRHSPYYLDCKTLVWTRHTWQDEKPRNNTKIAPMQEHLLTSVQRAATAMELIREKKREETSKL